MKRALPVLLIFLSGCLVQSFHPFYTDKSKVALPQLNGQWDLVTAWGEDASTNVLPWQISDNEIVAYDPNSQPSKVQAVFFKLGKTLFCDTTAGNIGDTKIPWYWAWHVFPVHTVTKVETNANSLIFTPLDLDWLTNRVATGRVSLPHLDEEKSLLFTAKAADWEKFLTKYANNMDAFPTNHIYALKRHVTAPTK
jgi:hypothetical protein